jgi:hypothetical protein
MRTLKPAAGTNAGHRASRHERTAERQCATAAHQTASNPAPAAGTPRPAPDAGEQSSHFRAPERTGPKGPFQYRRVLARVLPGSWPRCVTFSICELKGRVVLSRPTSATTTGSPAGALRDRLPGCDLERFGMGPAVMLGQDLSEVAGPVGDGAMADLAARDRQLRNGHREAAGR